MIIKEIFETERRQSVVFTLLLLVVGWTETQLVNWLDRTIPHHDVTLSDSGPFLVKILQALMDTRGLSLNQLVHDKYRLRRAVTAKINQHRKAARNEAFQQFLLPASSLVVTPELCFTYDPLRYPCKPYQGPYTFNKHYYRPQIGDFDSGEEEACAVFIDSLEEIEFWVRNPARGSKAFWLQTSSDRFYPDFVCKLKDGRYLVVEYKGADRWSNDDSREKRTLGELWEARSSGQCLFIMPKGKDFDAVSVKIGN